MGSSLRLTACCLQLSVLATGCATTAKRFPPKSGPPAGEIALLTVGGAALGAAAGAVTVLEESMEPKNIGIGAAVGAVLGLAIVAYRTPSTGIRAAGSAVLGAAIGAFVGGALLSGECGDTESCREGRPMLYGAAVGGGLGLVLGAIIGATSEAGATSDSDEETRKPVHPTRSDIPTEKPEVLESGPEPPTNAVADAEVGVAAHDASRPANLAIGFAVLSRDDAEKLGVAGGLRVSSMNIDGPAARAGIEVGDIICSINGGAVLSRDELRRVLSADPSLESVTVAVVRETVWLIDAAALAEARTPESPPRAPKLGVSFAAIGPREVGMRVEQVEPGSIAERAGILMNDVMLSIDDRPVASPQQLEHAIEDRHSTWTALFLKGYRPLELEVSFVPVVEGAVSDQQSAVRREPVAPSLQEDSDDADEGITTEGRESTEGEGEGHRNTMPPEAERRDKR